MTQGEPVSVIIPTYNRAAVLGRAMESVIKQTHPAQELIVVDDGSTDSTRELVEKLRPSSPIPVRYFRCPQNRGVSRARNLGIEQAQAPWLAFLDSDDEWLPQRLEKQLQLWRKSPHIKVWHGEEIWIRNGRRVNPMRKHQKHGGWIFLQCIPLCVISPSAALIHRQVFDQVGVFSEDYRVCEDYELWLRISSLYEVGFCDSPILVKYGGHEDQLSRRFVAMDYWRVKALDQILAQRPWLGPEERKLVVATLLGKVEILLNGYRKHNNFNHYAEIRALQQKYATHTPSSP